MTFLKLLSSFFFLFTYLFFFWGLHEGADAESLGCSLASVQLERILGHPALINDEASFEQVKQILLDSGQQALHPPPQNTSSCCCSSSSFSSFLHASALTQVVVTGPSLGGEDFAWYLQATKGCFWFLGACAERHMGQVNVKAHHSPNFEPDEAALSKGVHFWLLLSQSN